MPPRTRCATARKPIEDEKCTTPPSKSRVGGVLASLNQNVPATKSHKGGMKENSTKSEVETITTQNDYFMKTPPPPTSVVVGDANEPCSPLTQPRFPLSRRNRKKEEEESISSEESNSPIPRGRLPRKQTRVIEDESSDDDDEKTLEIDEEVNFCENEDDHSETIPGSEESDEDEEDSEDDDESEIESESEIQEDDEIEDAYEPEDDEYVPDDDDESVSDEDLDDYVEEVRESPKPRSRSRSQKASNPSIKDNAFDPRENDHQETADIDKDSVDYITNLDSDEATQIEETPAKHVKSTPCATTLDSPEPEIAVIVDDEDLDDDDDVLVATIVDDDDDDQKVSLRCEDSGVKSHETEAIEESYDDGPCPFSCEGEDDVIEILNKESRINTAEKQVESSEDNEPFNELRGGILYSEEEGKNTSSCRSTVVSSSTENDVAKQGTELKKQRKPRQSFFRMEGIVKRGKWKLGSRIGIGSFGAVHVGLNNETGKLMAVKRFKVNGADITDVRREVELMRSLHHENIVRYLGAQMDKTHLHIFQEWVPGGSVAALLGRFGSFTLRVIQSYLSQTLAGLAYLHENDIIHRDVKGSNILVNDEGIVKLADFGASKKLGNLQANLMMTMTVRGTPYFMAPEVFEEKYSAKADIWGIGCVVYQMITGSSPWKSEGFSNPISLFNHIKKHAGGPPVDVKHVERLSNENKNVFGLLCDLMESCYNKDPTERPDVRLLQEHAFFTEMHEDDESVYSNGLFSPANKTRLSTGSARSEKSDSRIVETPSPSPMRLPAPTPPSRSKSIIQWRSTFASPPKPKRAENKKLSSPLRASPYHSPPHDTSNWPDWARVELRKSSLFDQSPNKVGAGTSEETNISEMMGSLALSEDSEILSQHTHRRDSQTHSSTVGTTSDESKLAGLNFLEDSNATFEI